MTPEDVAAHDLRLFRRIRPGTVFSFLKNYQQEIAICKKLIDNSTLEVIFISEELFDTMPSPQKLSFSEVEMINILKENGVEITASHSWKYISLRDLSDVRSHVSLHQYGTPDDCFAALKENFSELESQISSMMTEQGPGKLYKLVVSSDLEEVKNFLMGRGWETLKPPPEFPDLFQS